MHEERGAGTDRVNPQKHVRILESIEGLTASVASLEDLATLIGEGSCGLNIKEVPNSFTPIPAMPLAQVLDFTLDALDSLSRRVLEQVDKLRTLLF
uniref:Uncharacterized protein n=1 Tax=viral metagenome TaxID=1070528 RepID=A0A6H2A5L7_9ZZZZ